ncbi:MAG: LytTR family transcriptional regulator DNA-binding domain-containing protein [Acutalibacteraceae bacterium]
MENSRKISFLSYRKNIELDAATVLYVIVRGKKAEVHTCDGKIYDTRCPISELEEKLGKGFIKVHRGCVVSAMAVHDITDKINLSNGESIDYSARRKNEIVSLIRSEKQSIINSFDSEGIPKTPEEYRRHYLSFDSLPFAFTDIEMIFNEESHAVDWIFRYGNPALAKLEKTPLEKLIGTSFGSLFNNMDSKWLRSYERATLYGEMLEMIDYSPEIDKNIKIICFPTFKGHCGCILFDLTEIEFINNGNEAEKALHYYLNAKPEETDNL